jgi:uncharacterized protein YndB with AHSA1/START domain
MSQTRTVFKGVVFSLAAAVLVVLGVGQVLAKDWQVETTRTLPAEPGKVAAMLCDLSTWAKWSAVDVQMGPQTAREVTGAPGGAGQRLVWSGTRGKAALVVTAVSDRRLDYTFGFEVDGAPPPGSGHVEWAAEGAGTKVRWVDRGVHANVMLRWFGWFGALQERVKQMQGASFEGLQEELAAGR